MPRLTCKQCGGQHLTQQCLAAKFAEQRQSADAAPELPHTNRPRPQKDWMLPQHEQLLDLLQHPSTLTGQDRDFVLEGIRNGPYGNESRVNTNSRVVVGPGYKLYIDGQLMHHGSVWSSKRLDQRHLEHVTNCVRDSNAWRGRRSDARLDEVARQVIDKFGDSNMYIRKHSKKPTRSVKVFDKGVRCCKDCNHCDAYELLNEFLGCEALHGPRRGWDAPKYLPNAAQQGTSDKSVEQDPASDVPDAEPQQLFEDHMFQPKERGLTSSRADAFPVSIWRFKKTDNLRELILTSDLAVHLMSLGVEIEPSWARGAKVLFPTRASALPSDVVSQLRPYHVLVRQQDEAMIKKQLNSMSYKQRPRHNDQQDQHISLAYVVENTFIHIAEPTMISPRSTFTKSSNDARCNYKNPRTWQCDWTSFTDAASSRGDEQVTPSFQDHFAKLKDCQSRLDLPSAIQCYSSMLGEEIRPSLQVFTIIVDICAKTGNCDEAERWMDTMYRKGEQPNLITFNCIINGYAHLGNASKAEEWFQKMLSAGLDPSLVTYNCLVQAYSKRGCIDKAEALLITAESKFGLNKHSYAPIIECFARKGLHGKAEAWFDRMSSSGVDYDSEAYGMMVAAAAAARDVERAWRWADRMQAAGHPLKVYEYTQLLKARAPRDNESEGRKLYDEATAIFHDQIRADVKPNLPNLNALKSAVGCDRALALCRELDVDIEAVELEYVTMNDEFGVGRWMSGKVGEDGAFRRNRFDPRDYVPEQ